jgi:hypothetical protein
MQKILFCFFSVFVPVIIQAQTFYLKPSAGVSVAYSRWVTRPIQAHTIGKTGEWFPSLGLLATYQRSQWGIAAGATLGAATYGVQRYMRLFPNGSDYMDVYREQTSGIGLASFPLEITYRLNNRSGRGKNIRLDALGGMAAINALSGGRVTQIGLSRSGTDYLVSQITLARKWSLASLLGARLTFLKNGSDHWAVTVFYQYGFQKILQAKTYYSYNGIEQQAQAFSQGSYLSVHLAKPVRLYQSANDRLRLAASDKADSSIYAPVRPLSTDLDKGHWRAFVKGMYFPGTVENKGNLEAGVQYLLKDRLAVGVGVFSYFFTYRLSGQHRNQYNAQLAVTRYFKGTRFNPYAGLSLGYDLQKNGSCVSTPYFRQ